MFLPRTRGQQAQAKEPVAKPPVYRSPYWRTWEFADGSRLDAELWDFGNGEAILRDDTGEEYGIKPSELSPADRKFVQDAVSARSEIARQEKEGLVIDCPNPKCRRGVLYGPVQGVRVTPVPGGAHVDSMSGLGPVGRCPQCRGYGVVPNPNRR